ncbi:MAG: RNA polymerase sigma factor [Cytophagaceae bacterium]|jgi:RNA polymerase sigma factor (sigma-70 family)
MTTVEFNNLVYTASKSLKHPALKYTRNNVEDANDLIQDALLKALRNKDKFKQGSNIKAWLYVIMKNTFISKYHHEKAMITDSIEEEYTLKSSEAITSNRAAGNMAMEDIQQAIKQLDKSLKDPFMLHFSGFKYEEIAVKLQIPLGTVKNRIHVARKTLMEMLKDYSM